MPQGNPAADGLRDGPPPQPWPGSWQGSEVLLQGPSRAPARQGSPRLRSSPTTARLQHGTGRLASEQNTLPSSEVRSMGMPLPWQNVPEGHRLQAGPDDQKPVLEAGQHPAADPVQPARLPGGPGGEGASA